MNEFSIHWMEKMMIALLNLRWIKINSSFYLFARTGEFVFFQSSPDVPMYHIILWWQRQYITIIVSQIQLISVHSFKIDARHNTPNDFFSSIYWFVVSLFAKHIKIQILIMIIINSLFYEDFCLVFLCGWIQLNKDTSFQF